MGVSPPRPELIGKKQTLQAGPIRRSHCYNRRMSQGAGADFSYYDALRQYQQSGVDTWDAVVFSRAFADLAARCLSAQAAQDGQPANAPDLLGLPALRAFQAARAGRDFAAEFLNSIPVSWMPEARRMLSGLAGWLVNGFEANNPLTYTFQVWVGYEGEQTLQLYGPSRRPDPPAPFKQLAEPPQQAWLRTNANRPIAVIAHYDVHGITMLSLTERYLRRLGFKQVDAALSFEWTGDISKLWKRAVPKTLTSEQGYCAVVMVDCPVHSRTPDYTLKALQRVDAQNDQRLIIVDHHIDTFALAPRLMYPGVHLALTDILSCGLTETWDGNDLDLMVVGALSDKVPEIYRSFPPGSHRHLHEAVEEYNRRTLVYSPTPPAMKEANIYPLKPLWDALVAGGQVNGELAGETLDSTAGAAPARPATRAGDPVDDAARAGVAPAALPSYSVLGGVALVTERLAAMGRAWYALLEQIMEEAGVPYAIAVRLLNGQNANMLLLTRWQEPDKPPIRMFVPAEYLSRCLGHSTAVWADLPREQALPFLRAVISRVADYAQAQVDPEDALGRVEQNILRAQPVSNEERNAHTAPLVREG